MKIKHFATIFNLKMRTNDLVGMKCDDLAKCGGNLYTCFID